MSIIRPKTTINIIPAAQNIDNQPQKVLFIGQKTAGGSATAGQVISNIQDDNSWNALFGADSILAAMLRNARAINKDTRFDAIALADNGSGVAAAGAVVFSGTATKSGSIYVVTGSSRNHKYEVVVEVGDTATAIGAKLAALINADTTAPVDAVNTTGSVAVTAVNKGVEGNNIALQVSGSVAGVTVALTAMTNGAGAPSTATVFDNVGNVRYQTIVYPASYDLTDATDFLDARFNVNNQVLDGVAVTYKTDTFANGVTLGNGHNSQNLSIGLNKLVNIATHKGGALLQLDYVVAAKFAAIRSLRLTDGANLSQLVLGTDGARDTFGGAHSASLPYFNTPLLQEDVIIESGEFISTEIDQLNAAGVWVLGNNIARTAVIFADIVTTYKTNAAGSPDVSYKYLNYVDTASAAREFFTNNLRNRFSQHRLTEGDLRQGRKMANAASVGAALDDFYATLSGDDYVLLQDGEQARKYFKRNRNVTLELATGTVNIDMLVPLVTQLRSFLATMQISFSVN